MPLIQQSSYRAPSWLPGGHTQTIYPALFRRVPHVTRRAERLELPDGDFIDLEWAGNGGPRLAILSHGLEANTKTDYIQGMAAAMLRRGWDVLAWNFRGCSHEPNRLLRMYHSGATEDLHAVISHALENHPAKSVDLIGFSLGGNLTLKYLGERPADLPPQIHRAVVFSVPCDLACSSAKLSIPSNRIYMERFLIAMRSKVRAKKRLFPDQLDLAGLNRIRTFQQFDDRYTAPIHGFLDAADYWKRNSSRQFIPSITVPTLLVNAANDPFLGPRCYPREESVASEHFHFEIPATGGHVGFPTFGTGGEYWPETRAVVFLMEPA
ncbi:alpha/beta fold hydrolase [Luteolibacter yonseiensis]|uniref:Alpha/beta fold hydrolase n=1 Tax=Luteolibacter yonseiensis TaxID=1144680 RepID=A0A934VB65_9BACT|nr:alpha/beta fold hydrolase [Luteolibacter yonseiensis]MBK1816938.1 alpha/beta fold hydrolase [Luteolibacter yonseiensis]